MDSFDLFGNFIEKTKITFLIVKYGIFLLPLFYIIEQSLYTWFLDELILFSFQLPLMLLFIFCYHLFRAYYNNEIIQLDELLL